MSRLHLYRNNPTEGKRDGTEISRGDGTSPFRFNLKEDAEDIDVHKVGIRCESGYMAKGACTVTFGETAGDGEWSLIKDEGYDEESVLERDGWATTLELKGVSDVNTIFWVKAETQGKEDAEEENQPGLYAQAYLIEANG